MMEIDKGKFFQKTDSTIVYPIINDEVIKKMYLSYYCTYMVMLYSHTIYYVNKILYKVIKMSTLKLEN